MSSESGEARLRRVEEHVASLNYEFTQILYSYVIQQTSELVQPTQTLELRQKVWTFYTKIVAERPDLLGVNRCYLLDLVRDTNFCDQDVSVCIDFLIACTDDGRQLACYESRFADLLSDFLAIVLVVSPIDNKVRCKRLEHSRQLRFLNYLIVLIKFNSVHVTTVSSKLVAYVYAVASDTRSNQVMAAIFEFLKALTSYSYLPNDALNHFVCTVCNGVASSENQEVCNAIMRNVLGNYRSFSCINALIYLVEDQINYNNPALLSGAINFISKSMWGDLATKDVRLSPNTALLAFYNVLSEAKPNDEVILAIAEGVLRFLLIIVKTTPFDGRQLQIHCQLKETKLQKLVFETILDTTWGLVLDICSSLFLVYTQPAVKNLEVKQALMKIVDVLIDDLLEKAYSETGTENPTVCLNFKTSVKLVLSNVALVDKLFATMELCFPFLEESYIRRVMKFRLFYIGQNVDSKFIRLKDFLDVYYGSNCFSKSLRIDCLSILQRFLHDNAIDVDEFWSHLASRYFGNVQPSVESPRELSVNLLVLIAMKSNSLENLSKIIDILGKIIMNKINWFNRRQHSLDTTRSSSLVQPMLSHQLSDPNTSEVMQNYDFVEAIDGLAKIFVAKLDHPECHAQAVEIFVLILDIASKFYHRNGDEQVQLSQTIHPSLLLQAKLIIFDLILSLRIDSLSRIGVLRESCNFHLLNSLSQEISLPPPKDEYHVKYSPYMTVDFSMMIETTVEQQQRQSASPQVKLTAAYQEALKLVLVCIDTERLWPVLAMIFCGLPKVLRHKGLIYNQLSMSSNPPSPYSSAMQLNVEPTFADSLLRTLSNFITQVQKMDRLNELKFCNIGAKMTKVEVVSYVYKSIIALIGHKLYTTNQTILVKHLLDGLVYFSSKASSLRQCIIALTDCAMEMQTTMNKQLNEIIKHLSKVCTNHNFAVPKLEFLSNIIIFPELCYTFILKQYMESSMIALHYVNPYRYGEFTVALALRAITIWFLKCPTSNRRSLVNYVMKGLQGNILNETPQVRSLSSAEKNNASVESHAGCSGTNEGFILDPSNMGNVHISKLDLLEVCMDMFSANAFTNASPLPFRSSMVDKLLNKDKTAYWIVGNKIVQLTTSGCSTRAVKEGLCSKCYTVCHMNKPLEEQGSSGLPMQTSAVPSKFGSKLKTHFKDVPSENLITPAATMTEFDKLRRRHRSALDKPTTTTVIGDSSTVASTTTITDDYFSYRGQGLAPGDGEVNAGQYCRCWCQCWAEVFIRRATGNSRWTLKMENNLGDFPNWSYSKEEDESLSNVFMHSHNEISLSLKVKKSLSLSKDNISQNSTNSSNGGGGGDYSPESKRKQQPRSSKLEKEDSFEEAVVDKVSPKSPNEDSFVEEGNGFGSNGRSNFRDRGATISVMSPAQKNGKRGSLKPAHSISGGGAGGGGRQSVIPGGLTPQSVFLQLYYSNPYFRKEIGPADGGGGGDVEKQKPILLFHPNDTSAKTKLLSSLKVFDTITPYETHKIGLLYVGPGQADNMTKILRNKCGSLRYTQLMKGVGELIDMTKVDPYVCHLGGLDPEDERDGQFAISWGDHLMQVIFHVATLMPFQEPKGNNKMMHIGNNLVVIVYNNSGQKVDFATIKGAGQVLQAMVLITPLPCDSNIVEVHAPQEFLDFFKHSEPHMISDKALPVYVRQLALHTNLAAMVSHKNKSLRTYSIWNWINRLHKIRSIREAALKYAKEHQLVESGAAGNTAGGGGHSATTASSFLVRSQSMQSQTPLIIGQRSRLSTQASKDEHDQQVGGHGLPAFQDDSGAEIIFSDFTTFT